MRTSTTLKALACASAALTLAACSSGSSGSSGSITSTAISTSTASSAAPSPNVTAQKIGCANPTQFSSLPSTAAAGVTCTIGSTPVTILTFTSEKNRDTWYTAAEAYGNSNVIRSGLVGIDPGNAANAATIKAALK